MHNPSVIYATRVREVVAFLNRSRFPAAVTRQVLQSVLPGGAAFKEFIQNGPPARQAGAWANRVSEWANPAVSVPNSFERLTNGQPCGAGFVEDGDTCHVGVTPEKDAAYAKAVESGDTATAQKMVDEAAAAAGYTVGPAVHRTNANFADFDISKSREGAVLGPAIYATLEGSWNPAQLASGRVASGYVGGRVVDMTKPITPEVAGAVGTLLGRTVTDALPLISLERRYGSVAAGLLKAGFSAAIHDGPGATGRHIAIFDTSKFKRSDAVVRDDTGSVIPLSQRFNSNNSKFNNRTDIVAATVLGQPVTVAAAPTDAQKESGNYLKGEATWNGLSISVENPKGGVRSGTNSEGETWATVMPASYGYVIDTEGADGDEVDVYLGDAPDSSKVFVIDQVDANTGDFDEHKVMLAFPNLFTALSTYHKGFSDGRGAERVGDVTPMTVDEFKAWLKMEDTTQPVSEELDNDAPWIEDDALSNKPCGASFISDDKTCREGDFSHAEGKQLVTKLRKSGGFTYEPAQNKSPKSGFAVSAYKHLEVVLNAKQLSVKAVKGFFDRAAETLKKDPLAHMGGWFDKVSGKIFLDVVQIHKAVGGAMEQAKQLKELAIFDLGKMAEIRLQNAAPGGRVSFIFPRGVSAEEMHEQIAKLVKENSEGTLENKACGKSFIGEEMECHIGETAPTKDAPVTAAVAATPKADKAGKTDSAGAKPMSTMAASGQIKMVKPKSIEEVGKLLGELKAHVETAKALPDTDKMKELKVLHALQQQQRAIGASRKLSDKIGEYLGAQPEAAKAAESPKAPEAAVKAVEEKPVKATAEEEAGKAAVTALKGGGDVVLKSVKEVNTAIEEIHKFANEAKKSGEKVNLNLCKVSVPGTNLFCGESLKGDDGKPIPRSEMPQLAGFPVKGSTVDDEKNFPKDKAGEVNVGEAFVQSLLKKGVKTEDIDQPASSLKASQSELKGSNVAFMMSPEGQKAVGLDENSIFVSRDGYVIDGHHRWAAKIGLDAKDGKFGDTKIKTRRIDMDIKDVLKAANKFTKEMGIAPKKLANRDEPMLNRNTGKPCGESSISADKTCHVGEGEGQTAPALRPASTESPEFKEWFGDSKVVDKDGKPLVVYHGTNAGFTEFGRVKEGLGSHFGTAQQANDIINYNFRSRFFQGYENPAYAEGANIKPVYISIKNPLRLDDFDWHNVHNKMFNEGVISKSKHKEWIDELNENSTYGSKGRWLVNVKWLNSIGYDGVIYDNKGESKGTSYIALRPEQIKSAFNRGTWSKGDRNISNSGQPCGDSFIEAGDTCHVGVTPEQDAAYTGAVAAGDTVTAQKMVDDAAKAAGYTVAYHRTRNGSPIEVFQTEYPRTPLSIENEVWGDFAAKHGADAWVKAVDAGKLPDDYKPSEGVGKTTYRKAVYLTPTVEDSNRLLKFTDIGVGMMKPVKYFVNLGRTATVKDGIRSSSNISSRDIDDLIRKGFNSVSGYMTAGGLGEVKTRSREIAVFDSARIKSSSPVVFDSAGNVIPLSKRFNRASNKISNSGQPCGESFIESGDTCHVGVTPEQDAAYAGAVASGDTFTAQKMVDEAAKAAGYGTKAYHGTDKKFTEFSNDVGDGIYFADSPVNDLPQMEVFLKTNNPLSVDAKGSQWYDVTYGNTRSDIGDIAGIAQTRGHDSLKVSNVVEGGQTATSNVTVVFSPSQIKSADPITRDDQGNVIPLSKRFNKSSNKISNSGEFEESLHPRAADGKFAPKEGGGLKEMAESNPQAKAAVSILGEIERQFPGTNPLIVGGAVRDMVMGKTPKDFDIATPLPAAKLQSAFRSHEIGNSADFGIVAIPHEGHTFEVAQFRTDGAYTDQRRPDSVTAAGSFDEDSKRRDFTINAMAMDAAGNLVDPQNGKADIEAKVIRAVGDPEARFTEDPLRMIRAARFAGRLGFDIEAKTMDAMKKLAPSVATISGERIRDEVFKAADNGKSLAKFVSVMSEAGLLEHTLPEVAAMRGLPHNPKHHPEGGVYEHVLEAVKASNTNDATTNVAILLHDIGKATTRGEKDGQPTYIAHEAAGIPLLEKAAARLKFSNEQKEAIALAVEHHMVGHNFDAVSDRLALRFRQEKNWPLLREVMRSDEASRGALFKAEDFEKKMGRADRLVEQFGKKEEMEKRLSAVFTGKDIMAAAPKLKGTQIGAVKASVRDWVLEKNFEVTPEQVRAKILEESEAMKNRADEPDEHPELAFTSQQS